ncbi:HK97-gp10 family putative phage morphogenesis protein [Macrococcus capreoli]|uniref:HK97-gp10 family putative phage morphogenesis protein n=1 Tax=Macrococcus capreoli TaxID=2982690 RepID=UPI003EE4C2CE
MDALVRALKDYEKEQLKWAKKGIRATILSIYNTAVAAAPTDTSYLKESIDFKLNDGGLSGVVSVGADYAVYVEFGTGIFATHGTSAKKIPWVYQSEDGEWVTTYGSPPQPFWRPAISAGEKTFLRYFG